MWNCWRCGKELRDTQPCPKCDGGVAPNTLNRTTLRKQVLLNRLALQESEESDVEEKAYDLVNGTSEADRA